MPSWRHSGSRSHSMPRQSQVVENLVRRRNGARPATRAAPSMSARSKLDTPHARMLSARAQRLETGHGLGERDVAAPVQQIQIETIGAEALQAALAGGSDAAAGSRGADRPCSPEIPRRAGPRSPRRRLLSAPPSAYISAVSISVMPRSRPSRSAAISCARSRARSPIRQVPIPSAGIEAPSGKAQVAESAAASSAAA